MRHAKSSWDDTAISDFDRDLTPRGVADAQLIAKRNREMLSRVELVCSSPAVRARKTILLVSKVISYDSGKIVWEDDIYEASLSRLLRVVNRLPQHINRALLVGHNPGFTSLSNHFLHEPIDNLPTSGLVALSFSSNSWNSVSRSNLVFSSVDFPKNAN